MPSAWPLYMPPETARGEKADARSDLYSLGATFYQVLAGKPPFEGRSAAEMIARHLEATPLPLAEVAPDTPLALSRIILRLLRKNPAERYRDAGELLRAIQDLPAARGAPSPEAPTRTQPGTAHQAAPRRRAVAGETPATVPAGELPHPSLDERREANRQRQRRLLRFSALGAGLLVLVLLLLLVLPSLGRRTPPPPLPTEASSAPPAPSPRPRTPASSPREKAAETLLASAQRTAKDGQWLSAKNYLGHLARDYRDTLTYRSRREAIESLSAQAEAALQRKSSPPKTAPENPPSPKPQPPPTSPDVARVPDKLPPPASPETPPKATRETRQQAGARFTEALEPIEAMIQAWDFAGAEAALAKLEFGEQDLAERLATRRDEAGRLAKLHAKMIERINATKPPLRRGSILIPGINADLVRADEKAIAARLDDGKTTTHDWPGLTKRSVHALTLLSIDRGSADDWLAAGILALLCEDATSAEKHFAKARELGAAIDRYLGPLAAATFVQAKDLLVKKQFADAEAALASLEAKYAKTPWLASHKDDLAAAHDGARAGVAEAEAEKLYQEAARLHKQQSYFDLKPLVEKLKAEYPKTQAVTDAKRAPSFGDLEAATKNLGKFLTVRQDGKGDFKTIQDAVDAAPPNSLIEIQDNGPYHGPVLIPMGKRGMTLRGKKGLWPVNSSTAEQPVRNLITIESPGVTLERIVLSHRYPPATGEAYALEVARSAGSFKLRSAILWAARNAEMSYNFFPDSEVENCLFARHGGGNWGLLAARDTIWLNAGNGTAHGSVRFENCFLAGFGYEGASCEFRHCTILRELGPRPGSAPATCTVADSILGSIRWVARTGLQAESCDVYESGFLDHAKPGKGCFKADPQFRDPATFDYRLKPTSPCRGKASDGGDLGVRWTPEMLELIEKAIELRRGKIIEF